MIRVILGKPGSGKTLYMLWLMCQYILAGRKVATNIRLLPACPFYDRVALIDDGDKHPVFQWDGKDSYRAWWEYLGPEWVVMVDEINNYFDATEHNRLPGDVRRYMQMHRHCGHDLVFSTQNFANLYVRIRRLAESFVVCEWNQRSDRVWQMLHLPVSWSRFNRSEFCGEDLSAASYMGSGYFSYAEAQRLFTWYDHRQLVSLPRSWACLQGIQKAV